MGLFCDTAREACPIIPGPGKRFHHSFEDPAAAPSDKQLEVFRNVRDEMRTWLTKFVRDAS